MSIYWRKRLGLSASVLAVGLVAAALVPGTARATPDPFHASAASLENIQKSWAYVSEYAYAPALASGRLTDPGGSAMAGATVIVFPVPKSPKAGERMTPVARATTNANGGYTLHLPAAERSLLLGTRSNVYMNMQIIAFYPDAMASWFMPLKPGAKEAVTANLVLRQLPSADAAKAAASAQATPQNPPTPPDASCAEVSNTEIPNVPMVVGYKSTLNASHINYAQITYSSTVSQSSGVGLSLSGAYGGFSSDGTTSTTSDVILPYPKISGASNNYMTAYTLWNDTKFHCQNAAFQWFYGWTVYLNSVSTADSTPGAPQVSAGDCSLEAPDVAIQYNTTSQKTWSTGVNISGHIGINLSSQDGWSTSSTLIYDLAVRAPICGVTNWPGGNNPSAGYLQVH